MPDISDTTLRIDDFIDQWVETPGRSRKAFLILKSHLEKISGARTDFIARKGVTYSLRTSLESHKRPLFSIIDVIEDDPRWLSVCFYSDMISDPENRGNFVPGGILGEDAHCFDLEDYDEDYLLYLKERIDEASGKAVEDGR